MPGTVLILSKAFQTATSPQGADPTGCRSTIRREPRSCSRNGSGPRWGCPSPGGSCGTRTPRPAPDVLRGLPGREPTGPTSPGQSFEHDPNAQFVPAAGAPVPGSYEERDFTIAPNEDNGRLDLHLQWPAGETELGPDDLDLRLYRRSEPRHLRADRELDQCRRARGSHRRRSTARRLQAPGRELVRDQRGGQELDRDAFVRASHRAGAGDARSVEPALHYPERQEGQRGGDGRSWRDLVEVDLRGCTSGGAGAGGMPPQPKPSSAG